MNIEDLIKIMPLGTAVYHRTVRSSGLPADVEGQQSVVTVGVQEKTEGRKVVDLVSALQNIGIFAVGSGILAYLIKQMFSISINKDLEKFKSDLQQATIEHQVRYTKLHEDRAEVLKTIYQKIVELEPTVNRIIFLRNSFPHTTDRAQKLDDLSREFQLLSTEFKGLSSYFQLNRIFFTEELCKLIDDLVEKFGNIYRGMNIIPPLPDHPYYKEKDINLQDFFATVLCQFRNVLMLPI